MIEEAEGLCALPIVVCHHLKKLGNPSKLPSLD
jgi:hypothetical protein